MSANIVLFSNIIFFIRFLIQLKTLILCIIQIWANMSPIITFPSHIINACYIALRNPDINFYCMCISMILFLSGEPDYFGRNKMLSGYDLSHYQVPYCIRVFFYFVWFVFIHHNFQFYFKLCTYCTFWIFTYHKIWILLIIFCFIWSYWIIYF